MRHFVLLLLLLAVSPNSLSSQPYLNESSQWQFRGGASDFSGNGYYMDRRYYLDGDTTITGQTYFKLYYDRQDTIRSLFSGNITGYDTIKHTYLAAIRESGTQFFWVPFYSDMEALIQDFELNIGDTVSWANCHYPVVVTGMDTVFLGPTPLRRFFLNNYDYEFILEGVGSTMGFLVTCPGAIGLEYNLDPVCYQRDGFQIALQLNGNCTLTSATGMGPAVRPLQISPNPSRGRLRIGGLRSGSHFEWRLYTMGGILLAEGVRTEDSLLDLGISTPGWYFLLVRDDKGMLWGSKIIINR